MKSHKYNFPKVPENVVGNQKGPDFEPIVKDLNASDMVDPIIGTQGIDMYHCNNNVKCY